MILLSEYTTWSFWLHLIVLGILVFEAIRKWRAPWAKATLAVYGTVAFWYTGDFILSRPNDYRIFDVTVVTMAFLQVTFFLLVFRFLVVPLTRYLCARPLQETRTFLSASGGATVVEFPPRLLRFLLPLLILVWSAIFLVGVKTSPQNWPALIWPPLHPTKVGMYPLTGLGGGASFIFNAVGYIHVLVCALFGVIAVVARGPVRWIALGMVCMTWPYFLYDAIRSKMLALILPGLSAFLLLGKRSAKMRITVIVIIALGVTAWFSRVMIYRSNAGNLMSFTDSSVPEGVDEEDAEAVAHANQQKLRESRMGLDMLKELCWINTFIESGRYTPSWGARYFAELVNPIPRSLWPGKPMLGIDYAIARGFGGSRREHGAFATVATGMIGQGCVNFGRFLGVPAAALLFALWAAFLSRLWCQRVFSPMRLALFLIGMGLTLNTGRDFTLLVLFPFLFGYLATLIYELVTGRKPGKTASRVIENTTQIK
jgi:hypothetical protein